MKNQTANATHENDNSLALLTEELISFNQVPPKLQTRVHVSTVWRWATRGVGGIRLETINLGGKRLTSTQAVTRFVEKISRN